MDRFLRNAFKQQIESRTGNDFEKFVTDFYLILDGVDDFIPTRQSGDKGADGIRSLAAMVIASYGPSRYDFKKFQGKANSDFLKYSKNFQAKYPKWRMMINHDAAPDQLTHIQSLQKEAELFGLSQIIAVIENDFKSWQRRRLAKLIDIPSEVYRVDYLREILEDLLKQAPSSAKREPYEKPMYIAEKIELNYTLEEVEGAKAEYDHLFECFSDIQSLLKGHTDDEIARIKYKIISDHYRFQGSFKDKIESQALMYMGNKKDDDYFFFVNAVLFYCFEQCLIGIKTNKENDSASSGK